MRHKNLSKKQAKSPYKRPKQKLREANKRKTPRKPSSV